MIYIANKSCRTAYSRKKSIFSSLFSFILLAYFCKLFFRNSRCHLVQICRGD